MYGLLGKNISYSFSKQFFTEKFKRKNLPFKYQNIDVATIGDFLDFLANHIEQLKGFNVTIPYKEAIFNFLDEIDEDAQQIGAVNCVKIIDNHYLKGYNTDFYGFITSLKPLLKKHHSKALILGTGGASKAVSYALKKLNIDFLFVSRNPLKDEISYDNLDAKLMEEFTLIINTTPLGTKGKLEDNCPIIPYEFLTKKHLLYDLIYNPSQTIFLKKGALQGAQTKNGLEMLELQAEKSWEIWSEDY